MSDPYQEWVAVRIGGGKANSVKQKLLAFLKKHKFYGTCVVKKGDPTDVWEFQNSELVQVYKHNNLTVVEIPSGFIARFPGLLEELVYQETDIVVATENGVFFHDFQYPGVGFG